MPNQNTSLAVTPNSVINYVEQICSMLKDPTQYQCDHDDPINEPYVEIKLYLSNKDQQYFLVKGDFCLTQHPLLLDAEGIYSYGCAIYFGFPRQEIEVILLDMMRDIKDKGEGKEVEPRCSFIFEDGTNVF